jgi:hypothetical protein
MLLSEQQADSLSFGIGSARGDGRGTVCSLTTEARASTHSLILTTHPCRGSTSCMRGKDVFGSTHPRPPATVTIEGRAAPSSLRAKKGIRPDKVRPVGLLIRRAAPARLRYTPLLLTSPPLILVVRRPVEGGPPKGRGREPYYCYRPEASFVGAWPDGQAHRLTRGSLRCTPSQPTRGPLASHPRGMGRHSVERRRAEAPPASDVRIRIGAVLHRWHRPRAYDAL